jgi:hypothetical protein
MKTLRPTDLPRLPTEVKNLVRDGVYALYTLRSHVLDRGVYVLVTKGKDFFVLSEVGDVLPSGPVTDLASLEMEQAVTFAGAGESVLINFFA